MLKFIQINIRKLVFTLVYFFGLTFGLAQGKTVWQIVQSGNNSEELSLARGVYKKFLEKDIGWEDGFFVIGHSDIKKDFPYMLPGVMDYWGGASRLLRIRIHQLNLLSGIEEKPSYGDWKLAIDILECNLDKSPSMGITDLSRNPKTN